MKGNRFFIGLVCAACVSVAVAKDKSDKIIYKWEADGLVHYSHIKPINVTNFVKLDSKGRTVEELSEDFDEIIEIAVRPEDAEQVEAENGDNEQGIDGEVQEELAVDREKKLREQNCQTAKKNMATLDGGEVYEPDSKGNMIRMTPEQIKSKRSNVQKDIDYFCNDK